MKESRPWSRPSTPAGALAVVVIGRCLAALRRHRIEHCEMTDLGGAPLAP